MAEGALALWSFSLPAIDTTSHPLMHQFHKPGEPKRSIVTLDPADWSGWLSARTEAEAKVYLRMFDAEEFETAPDPR